MGCFQSYTVFTEDELNTYQTLTKLSRAEIIHAYKRFQSIDPLAFGRSKKGWISLITVADSLTELRVNPFRYRLCRIFCSSDEGFMDFDDFLDLVSVMSDRAPLSKKLAWAFQLFDFNGDDAICSNDLNQVLDSLTNGELAQEAKDKIIHHLLKEGDVDGDEAISFPEFERVMTLHAGPDFMENFRFSL